MAGATTGTNGKASNVVGPTETIKPPNTAGADVATENIEGSEIKKWPGWPGDNVFRLVVPVVKVGSIIGKKGELIKKICEETRAKIRVLDGVVGTTDRIVLIYGKEELEAEMSPAMDAVIRVFKRVSDIGADGTTQESSTLSAIRLLVPPTQAINLIGKQGATIKSIQESSGATIRVLSGDELPYHKTAEERVVDIQGESSKVLRALEGVIGHLRKFLVDHNSVVPLFEKSHNTLNFPQPNVPAPVQAQDRIPVPDAFSDRAPWNSDKAPWSNNDKAPWSDKVQSLVQTAQQSVTDYSLPLKRDSIFLEHESQLDSEMQRPGYSSLYRPEPPLSNLRSTGLGRGISALVTQVTQTMQIPLSYAEDIIGVGGANIAYIRRTSGAGLTVQESGNMHDEITVEIKGTSAQVQSAQQLIQEFIDEHKDPLSSYSSRDPGMRQPFSHLPPPNSSYPSSSLPSQSYGGYGSSGLGGYSSSYRF